MFRIIGIGAFALRFIICTVVVGISASLARNQETAFQPVPTTTSYGTFTGGFGMITTAIGLASMFIEAIPILVVGGLEALSGVFLLGGGIAYVIGLRGISCNTNDFDSLAHNSLVNQGIYQNNPSQVGAFYLPTETNDGTVAFSRMQANCHEATADQVCQFIGFGLAIATVFLCFLFLRNGRPGKTSASYV